MNTLLVPVDFSETSRNAARFAASMANEMEDARVVFYHVYSPLAAGSDGTPLDIDTEARRKIVEMALDNLVSNLSLNADYSILAEEGDSLTENMVRYVRHQGADLVIMGLTGATRLEQILMGSNALRMAHEAVCPVLIVPPDATYTGIYNVLFTTDMKDVKLTTPIKQLRNILSLFKANLFVVTVDSHQSVEQTTEFKKEKIELEKMLAPFSPQFHFISIGDFVEAVNKFAADKKIDLIITVPRKHNFLTAIFNPSNTRKLIYHTHVPLLAIRE